MRLLFFGAVLATILAIGAASSVEDDAEDNDYCSGEGADSEKCKEEDAAAGDARSPSAVYVMEHGFLLGEDPNWLPRGTLLLSGAPGRGFEARLSDAKEFVQLRPELQQLMLQAATRSRYYAIRMYSPESPRRVLQASIPAKLLADNFEDWHDILEVTVGSTGVPVGLSYRVRHTLGLALFDHTQVHLAEPSKTEGPRVPPNSRDGLNGPGGAGDKQQGSQSILRKYWWIIILVVLALYNAGDDGGGQGQGGKAGGGGGGATGGGGGRK